MISRNLFILIICYAISWAIMALAFSATASVGYELTGDKAIALFPLIMQVLGACIITVPAARIMRERGRRSAFMIGSCLGILGAILCAYSVYIQSFWLLTASATLLGMFTGFGEFARYAAAESNVEGQTKSRAISIVISGGILAAFIGPSIANYSNQYYAHIAAYLGPYLAALVLSSISLILYSFLTLKRPSGETPEEHKVSSYELLKSPVFIVASSVAAIAYLVMAAMMDAFPITMIEHGMHFSDTTMVLQWHMLAMFAPSYLTSRFIDRFGITTAIFLGILFNLLGLLSALQGLLFSNFWLSLFMIGLGWNLMYLSGTELITNIKQSQRARAEGLNSLIIMSSFALSAPFAALLLNLFGWYMVSLFSLCLLFLASFITFKFRSFIVNSGKETEPVNEEIESRTTP